MKTIVRFAILLLLTTPSFSFALRGQDFAVCRLLSNRKPPAAYLIDSKHRIVRGPIDMGELPLRNERALEGYTKKTNHYIIIKPSTAIPLDTPRGVLLNRVGNICKGAATYEVVLQWNIREGEVRPYPFSLIVPDFYIEDDYGYNIFSDEVYNFDARVIGVMVLP